MTGHAPAESWQLRTGEKVDKFDMYRRRGALAPPYYRLFDSGLRSQNRRRVVFSMPESGR